MKVPNYITQLSRSDLNEIAKMVNAVPGFCIRLDKTDDQVKISIDENQLKLAIWAFYRNGGCSQSTIDAVIATPFNLPA